MPHASKTRPPDASQKADNLANENARSGAADDAPVELRDLAEQEQLAWARQRLWLLVVPALMAVSPQISPEYGPYVALGLILVSHLPTSRSLREFFRSETAAG